MLVDAQVDQRISLRAVEHQGRRMLAAMLAASIAPGFQRRHQAVLEIVTLHRREGSAIAMRGASEIRPLPMAHHVGSQKWPDQS